MAAHHEVRMGSQGRLVIPAALRAELSAEEGTVYMAHVDDSGALVLRTREQALHELQDAWARRDDQPSATDELITERRREAAGT